MFNLNLYIKSFIVVIVLFLSHSVMFSQTGTVRGFIYEEDTGEPAIFLSVYLNRTTYGAITDDNGFFNVSGVAVGKYTLIVTGVGYDTIKKSVSITAGGIVNEKIFLVSSTTMLQSVRISADKQAAKTETRTSLVKITPRQISKMPTSGGIPDLAQYIQVVPGVVFTGDQGGQLYIRGGSPIQNKVLLDGMIIYNPFHSIGFFSVFDTDIMRNVDVYTGGFGAEYGGRISSIMDIKTRDGNKKKHVGKYGISPFGAKLLIEGPIVKQKKAGQAGSSFILSTKTSYLEQTSKVMYNYIDSNGLPFNFTDLYGKVTFNGANGSKANLFGFKFNDRVRYKVLSDYHWDSWGAGANFLLIPGASNAIVEGNFAFSKYSILLDQPGMPSRSSDISGFNGGVESKYFMGDNEMRYGFEIMGFETDFSYFNLNNKVISQTEFTTEVAGYMKYKYLFEKLLLEPSFRIHYYASHSQASPEPRIALKYNWTDNIRTKVAAGMYSQNLISANSDRDVVNLFYGFLSGPDNLPNEFRGKEITHSLQKAEQLIVGTEVDLFKIINLNLEGYYKNFSQLTNLNRNKLFDDDPDIDKPDIYKKDYIIETGNAYGFDVSAKYDHNRLYLWAVYSLGYINRSDEIIDYIPHFDRRHNVNLLGSVEIGKKLDWELSVRWNFGSGFPFTKTAAYFGKISFDDGINTSYTTANETLGVYYGELNGGRLPYYHRFDLTIKKYFYLTSTSKLEVNVGVTNLYNRENIFYFDRIIHERVNQLPIMPSFGIIMNF